MSGARGAVAAVDPAAAAARRAIPEPNCRRRRRGRRRPSRRLRSRRRRRCSSRRRAPSCRRSRRRRRRTRRRAAASATCPTAARTPSAPNGRRTSAVPKRGGDGECDGESQPWRCDLRCYHNDGGDCDPKPSPDASPPPVKPSPKPCIPYDKCFDDPAHGCDAEEMMQKNCGTPFLRAATRQVNPGACEKSTLCDDLASGPSGCVRRQKGQHNGVPNENFWDTHTVPCADFTTKEKCEELAPSYNVDFCVWSGVVFRDVCPMTWATAARRLLRRRRCRRRPRRRRPRRRRRLAAAELPPPPPPLIESPTPEPKPCHSCAPTRPTTYASARTSARTTRTSPPTARHLQPAALPGAVALAAAAVGAAAAPPSSPPLSAPPPSVLPPSPPPSPRQCAPQRRVPAAARRHGVLEFGRGRQRRYEAASRAALRTNLVSPRGIDPRGEQLDGKDITQNPALAYKGVSIR